MHVEILTPEKKLFDGEAEGVRLPGTGGLFEILNHHAPLISSLGMGRIRVKTSGKSEEFKISGGFVEVLNNKVSVVVEPAQD